MTIQTTFRDWQANPDRSKTACAHALVALQAYISERWGGMDLGCYSDRSIIGGSSPSSHASGAAWDWRYESPGIGREQMVAEVLPFLIDNSAELGVQAIHDYAGSRIWRPPSYRGGGDGWKNQPQGSQMGQSWARWLHIEVTPEAWADGRPIEQKVGSPLPAPTPRPKWRTIKMQLTMQEVRRGQRGAPVAKMQRALNHVTGEQIEVDGDFGSKTGEAVRRLQLWFRETTRPNTVVDPEGEEVVGPQTWRILFEEPWAR